MKIFFKQIQSFSSIFVFFYLFTSTNPLQAQWIQTNGPYGGQVSCFAASGTNLYAGTIGGGVFLSTNNGTSWTAVNNGLTDIYIGALTVMGINLFAGTSDGVFLSTNNGTSWNAAKTGLPTIPNVQTFAVSGTNIFTGLFFEGVFRSTNNGATWISAGLTDYGIRALAFSGTNLFAGTNGDGAFLSTNNGTSWTAVNNGLSDQYIISFAFSGSNLFAGTGSHGIFRSTTNGLSWISVSSGVNGSVLALTFSGTNLFAGTNTDGVTLSTNNGSNWTAINEGLTSLLVSSLIVSGINLFAGTEDSVVWRRPLSEVISVNNISTEVPEQFTLSQNYPNPFNPVTNLEFGISKFGFVSLKVYDLLGKEVATLVNDNLSPGKYKVAFDGSNFTSGVYFYRIETGSFTETKRMLLLK